MADSSTDQGANAQTNSPGDQAKQISVTIKTTKEKQVIVIEENASIQEVSANDNTFIARLHLFPLFFLFPFSHDNSLTLFFLIYFSYNFISMKLYDYMVL